MEQLVPSQALLRDHMEARRKEAKEWRDKVEEHNKKIMELVEWNGEMAKEMNKERRVAQVKLWEEQFKHNNTMELKHLEMMRRINFGIDSTIRNQDTLMDQFLMVSQDNAETRTRLKEIEEAQRDIKEKLDRLLGDSFVMLKAPKIKKTIEKKGYSLRKKQRVDYTRKNFKKGITY